MSANRRRSFVLVAVFILIIGLLGWTIDQALEAGSVFIVIGVLVAVGMAVGGYFGGDRLALVTSGAHGPIDRQDNPYLWRMVENLSITAGLPVPQIYLIDSPQINAFATGRDLKHASVAVTTGAVERLENEELEGVLAHELSHVRNLDIRFMTLVTVLVGIIIMFGDLFWRTRWLGGGRRGGNRSAGQVQAILLLIGLVLLILAPIIARLLQFAVSRRREFLADAAGALLTRYPEGLARALEKIAQTTEPLSRANNATAHLFISNPFGPSVRGLAKLFSTHPPIPERVAALRAMGGVDS
ncbi:MAG: M48 family metallopeptidase [Candidatus Kerfeldbacteria bacterium]|nr:M48 family metallopeptidase [Candidatus Kerfeldbacteria bacterium]